MDLGEGNDTWQWHEDDYYLQTHSRLDISPSLWDELDKGQDDLLCVLDEATPIKHCADVNFRFPDDGEDINKEFEAHRDSSQTKRRRMLQFSTNEEVSSVLVTSKARESLFMEEIVPDNLQWGSEFMDGCDSSNEVLDSSSEGWLAACFNDSEMHMNEMADVSDVQLAISEYCNIPQEVKTDRVLDSTAQPSSRFIFKGRRSFIRTPELVTTIAYPFALIKPCSAQGDVTLKDINQKIRTPPPTQNDKEKDVSATYPTSAFSGKPVVLRTKIHTEGGKGSITIMRTKG